MTRQALSDYKDLLSFIARLPDQVAPIVVKSLTDEMDNLWEEMSALERMEAARFSRQLAVTVDEVVA